MEKTGTYPMAFSNVCNIRLNTIQWSQFCILCKMIRYRRRISIRPLRKIKCMRIYNDSKDWHLIFRKPKLFVFIASFLYVTFPSSIWRKKILIMWLIPKFHSSIAFNFFLVQPHAHDIGSIKLENVFKLFSIRYWKMN